MPCWPKRRARPAPSPAPLSPTWWPRRRPAWCCRPCWPPTFPRNMSSAPRWAAPWRPWVPRPRARRRRCAAWPRATSRKWSISSPADRKSTRLNSSHQIISYAVFCLKKKNVFRSGDSSKKFKIAEGQWYRYAPSYVSPAYHLLEGFPFIQEPPSGDLQERVLIRHHDYDQCFQSVQLFFFFSQVESNVTVHLSLPTPRAS